MKKKLSWFERLAKIVGPEHAAGASKHTRGRQKPRNWKRNKQQARKRAKLARRKNR